MDADADRLSPAKCHRPVASRAISPLYAAILSLVLAFASFSLSIVFLDIRTLYILSAYLLINISYTFVLKRFSLIDIILISTGFVLRLWLGSMATGCVLSPWIVIVTFILSIFLALGKRREDVEYYKEKNLSLRITAQKYSLKFIDAAMALSGAAVITSYFIYTIVPSDSRIITSDYFYITGLPVIVGVLRYLQICIDNNDGGAAHHKLLINDIVILLSIAFYLALFFFFLYGTPCSI